MQLGNQVEWGLHCVVTLASLPADGRLSAASMAELYEVPPKYLAKALQALAVAGLVTTTPGPRGGYQLARDPANITLMDIVDAIEGRDPMFRCTEIRRRGPCKKLGKASVSAVCQIADVMNQAEDAYRGVLRHRTVADLVSQVVREVSPVVLNVVRSWVEQKVVQPSASAEGS